MSKKFVLVMLLLVATISLFAMDVPIVHGRVTQWTMQPNSADISTTDPTLQPRPNQLVFIRYWIDGKEETITVSTDFNGEYSKLMPISEAIRIQRMEVGLNLLQSTDCISSTSSIVFDPCILSPTPRADFTLESSTGGFQ